jgi:transcriptional regulator with XRE-family HTH domain
MEYNIYIRGNVNTGKMELRIKEVLKLQQRSIASVAREIGITYANLNNIVNGKVSPNINTLKRIADSLRVPISDLLVTGEVSGFLKYRGEVHAIHSVDGLEELLARIKKEGKS